MCVAIHKPSGAEIPRNVLKACFEVNDDGAGFALNVQTGEGKSRRTAVVVHKGYFTFDAFWEAWEEKAGREYNALIHFRIATSGGTTKDNCHPFLVKAPGGQTLALIHNGVMGHFASLAPKDKSDTRVFAERLVEPLFKKDPYMLKRTGLLGFIEKGIGPGNKIIMMDNDGRVEILNGLAGDWVTFEKDAPAVWFSNTYWKNRMNCKTAADKTARSTVPWAAPRSAAESAAALQMAWEGACGYDMSDFDDATDTGVVAPPEEWLKRFHPTKSNKETKVETDDEVYVRIATLAKTQCPRQLPIRSNADERRGEQDKTFWEDGYVDARMGRRYAEASSTAAYQEGYIAGISDIEDDPIFETGYDDFNRNAGRREVLGINARCLYMAGYFWAALEYEDKHGTVESDSVDSVTGGITDPPEPGERTVGSGESLVVRN